MNNFLSVCIIFITVLQACSQTENESADVLLTSLYTGDKPGAAVAVIKSGELIFRKAYGVADMSQKTPVTTSANFNICSLTKQFTAYSVLKLESEKKLSLDDKIGRYFPDINSRVAGAITIRHLLAHSSGIVDHYGYVDKKQFSEFSDRDVLNAISSVDSLYFNPGSGYRYSNTAYCLLSLIIEKVTGMSYPEYIRQNIFTPLKMS
jgi:D-alanyl-D-alanine carboxypeptidase